MTGHHEGVGVAGVAVVEEDGAWAGKALIHAENETSTGTAPATNRECSLK